MEAGPVSPEGHLALAAGRTRYGKSCLNCSRAKCKCNFLPGQPACQRCDRLNKQCRPLVSVRKGQTPQSETASTSNDEDSVINAKLEELISLLQARKAVSAASSTIQTHQSNVFEGHDDVNRSASLPVHLRLDPTAMLELTDDTTAAAALYKLHRNGLDDCVDRITIPKLPVSPDQATRCFQRFRTRMLPCLPFMRLPDSMTVAELGRTYPVLHLCILATAATSTLQLYDWSEQLRQTVVKKMYDKGERSLDLIFAILAFAGWLRHHRQEKPFFNLWLHMAMALATDLGLDKRIHGSNVWWPWHQNTLVVEQSIEEQRAILALFILSSTASTSIKSVDSLPWTVHMDKCLQRFEAAPEWYGDSILAIQVRCCLITESLGRLDQSVSFVYETLVSGLQLTTTKQKHSLDRIAGLELQLQDIRDKAKDCNLDQNVMVVMCIITTELDIHETIADPEVPMEDQGISESEKLSRFNRQLACLKEWWEIFLSIEPDQLPDLPFLVLTQLIHCIVSLFRLTVLRHPQWNPAVVRSTADVLSYLNIYSKIAEETHERVGLICDRSDDLFTKTASTMRKLRQYFLNIMVTNNLTSLSAEGSQADFSTPIPDIMDLDFWSNEWLSDVIVSWDK